MVTRLIATDIDGTMLRSDGTLSPRVQKALHAASNAGIHVVPTTGRPLIVSYDVIDELRLNNYWIFANGAVTRHLGRDELIRGYWIDPSVAQGLVVELRASIEGAGYAIEMERTAVFEPGFEKRVPAIPGVHAVDDVLDGITARVQKVLVFHDDLTIDELYQRVLEVVGDHAVPSYSGLNFIEVAAALVTKAVGVEQLANDLGIERHEVASFGDNHNDVSMLEWTGRSFAMANATDDAKEAADEVIGSNDDDGLAIKVEELTEEFLGSP
ncbi:MAG: Cof subfamily protein (haloacid dehalogenase superfamily) [Acidimicrobiales bacterium]|jgi:Cof subfamily protein (haloacid dehalogenase superfamily)